MQSNKLIVIEEIKKGKSLRQTSKKYNIPLSTVANWCNEENIKSTHTRMPVKATDKEILDILSKNKVMTANQLETVFGYYENGLSRRLKNLLQDKKINYAVIPGGGGKASSVFREYIDKRLYYVEQSDLNTWVKNQLPKQMPCNLRRAISQRLRDSGIELSVEKINKKAFVVEKKLYDSIKNNASKKGLSIPEYLKKAISHD